MLWAFALVMAAAVGGIVVARRAIAQACNFVNPQSYALQLTSVTVDGVPVDLSSNSCDNTATLMKAWYTPKRVNNYDMEILSLYAADGGTPSSIPPCVGTRQMSEDLQLDLVSTDGGVDAG